MSFTSLEYLLYVLLSAACYYILPKRMQWIVLLVFSYVFYALAGWKLLFFLLFTTASTFLAGSVIQREKSHPNPETTGEDIGSALLTGFTMSRGTGSRRGQKESEKGEGKSGKWKQKACLILVLFLNFSILFAFKYMNPVIDLLTPLTVFLGIRHIHYVLMQAPVSPEVYEKEKVYRTTASDYYAFIAEEYHLVYIDCNHENLDPFTNDLSVSYIDNQGHMNGEAAEEFSLWLGKKLKNLK